ncbi:MAG: hypothetical protein GTO41_18040, partial [Burkholderiales bacterium]|nr:hypothetical protein [Burkholderiales bacterium]
DFIDRFSSSDVYHYYRPIVFRDNCLTCHAPSEKDPITGEYQLISWSDKEKLAELDTPVYFM